MPRNKNTALFEHIGSKLKAKRIELKIKKETLVELLNVDSLQIWKYETGKIKIPIDYLFKLSELFGVGLDYFIPDYKNGKKLDSTIKSTKENPKLEKGIYIIKQVFNSKDKEIILKMEFCLDGIETALKKQTKQKADKAVHAKKRTAGD